MNYPSPKLCRTIAFLSFGGRWPSCVMTITVTKAVIAKTIYQDIPSTLNWGYMAPNSRYLGLN